MKNIIRTPQHNRKISEGVKRYYATTVGQLKKAVQSDIQRMRMIDMYRKARENNGVKNHLRDENIEKK